MSELEYTLFRNHRASSGYIRSIDTYKQIVSTFDIEIIYYRYEENKEFGLTIKVSDFSDDMARIIHENEYLFIHFESKNIDILYNKVQVILQDIKNISSLERFGDAFKNHQEIKDGLSIGPIGIYKKN